MSERIDVLAVMGDAAREHDHAPHFRSQILAARTAVAELAKRSRATVRAFEALGNANGVVANLEAHRECERALIEQKAALARIAPTELHDKAAELRGRGE